MNARIPIALTICLLLIAFGGFYFALSPRSTDGVAPPARVIRPAPAPEGSAQAPSAPPPASQQTEDKVPVAPPPPAPPPMATPASIEAEIANSENAELQALLKANFADEYNALMTLAARMRNDGMGADQLSKEVITRLQDMMRSKLKYAVSASMAVIDRLAANETRLFHALSTDASDFCLQLLGKDDRSSSAQPPANVREMMRLGTLYRFQAIVDGMPNFRPVTALTPDDMRAFEGSLAADGMKFDDVRSGSFLTKEGNEPGKQCLMLERLYLAIARLPDDTRRKIYAGMFFLDRDK